MRKLLTCPQLILWLGTLAVLCGAWFIEYGLKVQPCALCLLQRWPYYILLGAVPAMHLLNMRAQYQHILLALICLASVGLGIYHSGVELHWWEGFTSCSAKIDPMDTAALMAALDRPGALIPRCDGIYFTILGFSLANWNILVSAIGVGYAGWNAEKRQRFSIH